MILRPPRSTRTDTPCPFTTLVRSGRPRADLVDWLPAGDRRMGSNPKANGGRLLRPLELPSIRDFAVEGKEPGTPTSEPTRVLGGWLREVMRADENERSFRLFGPDETASNRLQDVYEVKIGRAPWREREGRDV